VSELQKYGQWLRYLTLPYQSHLRALSCRCGEDGRVFHYDLRCPSARQSLLVCTKSNKYGVHPPPFSPYPTPLKAQRRF